MSNKEQVAELYAAEVKQADIDHHKPTAGAMVGHILANFWVFDVKLHQVKWYVKGPLAQAALSLLDAEISANRQNIDELGELLLDENEIAPSTLKEIHEYGKLDEDASYKYLDADELIGKLAADYVMQDLFIDRAIKLANNENRPGLAEYLVGRRRYNNRQQRQLQALIGKTAWQDLIEEDDED